MVGDLLPSASLIAAAALIRQNPGLTLVDPALTFLFSVLVVMSTIRVFKSSMRFLMESSPENIDPKDVFNAMMELAEVKEIHDFHLWCLSNEKPILTAHVTVAGNQNCALKHINKMLKADFGIYHSTVQVELAKSISKSRGLQSCVNEQCPHRQQPEQPKLLEP